MKIFKAIKIGLFILNSLSDKSLDGKISVKDLLDIAKETAKILDYDIEDEGFEITKVDL